MHKDTSNTNPEGNKSPAIDYFIVLFGSILILTIVLTIVINQEWSERVIQNTFNLNTFKFVSDEVESIKNGASESVIFV